MLYKVETESFYYFTTFHQTRHGLVLKVGDVTVEQL